MASEAEVSEFGWLTGNEVAKQVGLGRIKISPFVKEQMNPNSYNYRLHSLIRRLTNEVIDTRRPDEFEDLKIPQDGLILQPGECYLGCTAEEFGSNHYAALVTGRSSIGRKFVTNHITAGLIDQGFFGQITLEITVQRPTKVYPGIVFGQIFWFTAVGAATLYQGKYAGQTDPTASKAHLDILEAG